MPNLLSCVRWVRPEVLVLFVSSNPEIPGVAVRLLRALLFLSHLDPFVLD
jgi:hypothetical protein